MAQLHQLRHALDSLHQEIAQAGHSDRSRLIALEKLDRALLELNRVTNESFVKRVLSDAKLYLNLPQGATVAAIGGVIGSLLGTSIPLAALAAVGLTRR